MDIQLSFKADSQLAKACKPAVRPLHHPPVFAQPLAALNASSGNPANDAPLPQVGSASLEVVAFVGVHLGWSFTCRFTPLNKITRGMPLAFTTMCRLEPSLPLSVGLGPVSWPLGAWYRGAINAGPAPIDLVMSTHASQHGLVQLLPDTGGIPVVQAPPAGHAAAVPKKLGKSSQGMPVCSTNKMPLRAAHR